MYARYQLKPQQEPSAPIRFSQHWGAHSWALRNPTKLKYTLKVPFPHSLHRQDELKVSVGSDVAFVLCDEAGSRAPLDVTPLDEGGPRLMRVSICSKEFEGSVDVELPEDAQCPAGVIMYPYDKEGNTICLEFEVPHRDAHYINTVASQLYTTVREKDANHLASLWQKVRRQLFDPAVERRLRDLRAASLDSILPDDMLYEVALRDVAGSNWSMGLSLKVLEYVMEDAGISVLQGSRRRIVSQSKVGKWADLQKRFGCYEQMMKVLLSEGGVTRETFRRHFDLKILVGLEGDLSFTQSPGVHVLGVEVEDGSPANLSNETFVEVARLPWKWPGLLEGSMVAYLFPRVLSKFAKDDPEVLGELMRQSTE